jgi:hypothetical protein
MEIRKVASRLCVLHSGVFWRKAGCSIHRVAERANLLMISPGSRVEGEARPSFRTHKWTGSKIPLKAP